jgi:hypothetical protein
MAIKATVKPAATKKLAKPKSTPAAKVAKAEKETSFKEATVVQFAGYKSEQEDPMFAEGDRVYIISKEKNEDQQTVYGIIAEADIEAYKNDADSVDGDEVFASELTKAEVVAVDPFAIVIPETERLTELLGEHDGDALATGRAMQDEIAENMFYFGGVLGTLYKDAHFRTLGDYDDIVVDDKPKYGTGWDKFCQENFGMGGRKGDGLIRMYRQFAGIPDLDLSALSKDKKLGWVKLERIATVITKDNADEILEMARTNNVETVRETIKSDYVPAAGAASESRSAGPRIKRLTTKFAFFEDQAEGIEQILDLAQKQFGYSDASQTAEHIFTEWASEHLGEAQYNKVRKAKKAKRKALKTSGVDIAEREAADAALEAAIAEAEGEPEAEAAAAAE